MPNLSRKQARRCPLGHQNPCLGVSTFGVGHYPLERHLFPAGAFLYVQYNTIFLGFQVLFPAVLLVLSQKQCYNKVKIM